MIRQIVEWSTQARVLVLALAVGLMVFGSTQVDKAAVDTLPEFQPTTVQIQAEALGLSAAEVEQMVTSPLEQDLLSFVPFVETIRSETVNGLVSIELTFEPGTDPLVARQVVQERLSEAAVNLPGASKVPQMLQPTSSTNRVMMVGLTSNDVSLIDMSVLARWTIKPALSGVPGVANVEIWGQREQQLQVQVDPQRLQDNNVSLGQVIESAANSLWWSPLGFTEASSPGTSGFFDTPNQRLNVQHLPTISTPEDLSGVPIQEKEHLLLKDVANVVTGHQLLIGDAVINKGPSLLLVIEKFPETNTLDVTRDVEKKLNELKPGLTGIEVDPTIYRPATTIDDGINDLTVAAVIGLVLVVLLFAAFFFDWRSALISAVAIPISLLTAGLVLYLTGATFNILVVAGLVMALAIVVEDAITDVDNIKRRLREREAGGAQEATDSVIVSAITEMRSSLIVGSLIVLLSVLPLFFLNGPSGEFFPPMVLAYALAVITAMLVSLTVTPALAMFLLANAPASRQESPFARMIKGRYGAAFAGVVQKPSLPYLALAIMAVLGITAAAQLSQPSLLPEFKQRDLLIHWDGPAGTSEPEMNRIVSAAATELQSIPGVENVGAHVGRAITSDQVVGINSGEIWVRVAGDADYNGTVSTIREVVDGYPGLSHEVVTYPKERVRQLLTGNDDDLTVRLYGEQLSVLRPEADKLRQSISGVQGVASPQVKLPVVEPTIEVEVDLAAAASNGLNPGEIRRAATTYLASLFVGALFEQNKVFEVVVWSTPETRANLDKVRALPIQKADGTAVPLDQVADVRIAANPNVIQREAVSRYLDITADISGRDRGAVVSDIENLLQRSTFPLEYHAEVIDSDKGLPDQTNSGLPLAIAAAVIMFLLLQLAFGSWRLAALFFVTMPAALAGGALAAFVDGADLTIGSYAGFLALLAITARSCIVMVRRYRDLQQQAGGAITDDLVLTATQERVAPILVTAVATFLALLPLIFVGDVFGHEVITPMAIVMIGGLITSTFYTLFIVPALYLRFAPAPASEKQRSQLRIRQKEAPAS